VATVVRIEYYDGSQQEYTFEDGRAYWWVRDEARDRGMVATRAMVRLGTTRQHAVGYLGHLLRAAPGALRVVVVRNGRKRVLRER
jgi:hypothetical protein